MIRDYLGKFLTVSALAGVLGVAAVAPAAAQEAAMGVSEETTYVFNTLLFLMAGFLVMWMAAGFCMLESGLVRSKNVTMQSLKNMSLYSIACLLYLFIGYGFMYPGSWIAEGFLGMTSVTSLPGHEGEDITYASVGSDFFFQLVFCAATASIVSGTVAERIKLWPFLIFTVVLTGLIYPIQGSWTWGGGWLSEMGFSDFAGSTIVHSVGGWAALTGAIILGARKGKYGPDGKVHPMPGSNLTLATLGTFILWLGWFGFNGGSQLAMGSLGDVSDVSRIFANTNTAAAAGALAALILTAILYKKPDLTMVLNGALAGLVAITAEPLAPSLMWSVVVGAIGGVIVVFTVPLLDKFKIDDVVGAIPVHLFAGIWGTIAVVFSNGDAEIGTQIIGIVAIGAFVVVTSGAFWLILKAVMGLRPTEEEEELGLDQAELGMEAYPEFGRGSQSL